MDGYFNDYSSPIIKKIKSNNRLFRLINKSIISQNRISKNKYINNYDDIHQKIISETFMKFKKHLETKNPIFTDKKHVVNKIASTSNTVILDMMRKLYGRKENITFNQKDILDCGNLYKMLDNPNAEVKTKINHTKMILEEKDSDNNKFMKELKHCL